MPKGRRGYYKQPSSVWREDWSNDVLATIVRLQAYMEERWARDGIDASEAGRVEIPMSIVQTLTHKGRPDVAERLARSLADVATMSVERRGDVLSIDWPKFAEYQHNFGRFAREKGPPRPASGSGVPHTSKNALSSRERGSPDGDTARADLDSPREGAGSESPHGPDSESPAAKPRAKRASAKTRAPEALTEEQRGQLTTWAKSKQPWAVPRLLELEEACLMHHAAKGSLMADWVKTVMGWIQREPQMNGSRGGRAPARASPRGSKPRIDASDDGWSWVKRREQS